MKNIIATILMSIITVCGNSQSHPKLVLTKKGVSEIQAGVGKYPVLNDALLHTIAEVDAEIENGIEVPIPKDMAGGYTHDRHKKNWLILQKAGVLFQITEDEKYANYIKEMLLEYAEMYPNLPLHPTNRSYAPGKIFWQNLNDANWLVYVSQAYDCVYDWLSKADRKMLEEQLFKPYADHLSIDSPQFFNRVHNHSTWGNAAVGMIGLVMDDQELIDRALYGLRDDNIDAERTDDDGGLIKMPGQKAGFLAQIDNLFSPDGYYTEGPYYQRYAMYPFVLFGESLENCKPEFKIFEYRDSLLVKAIYALLNLTDTNGRFFPLNDAQKGMSYLSRELVASVNVIYHFGGNDPMLLSIAQKQGKVLLDDTGLSVAKGIAEGKTQEFKRESIEFGDGKNGDEGGIGILRSGGLDDELCVLMKYSAQGMGHGHFDKLSFMLYDKGKEVLQDYGMARFVNIDQKYGGAYLRENRTWSKQTLAHNTLVVNQTSHFNGNTKVGNKYHSEKYIFNAEDENVQLVSAKENNAYPGVKMHRTMAIIKDEAFEKPLVLDIFRVNSESENTYDLVFNYLGQVIQTSFDYEVPTVLEPLGEKYGYHHVWKEAEGVAGAENSVFTWMWNRRFYTITTTTSANDKLLFGRLGAADPNHNLRRDPSYIIRKEGSSDAIFVSAIEAHGSYDPVSEQCLNSITSISNVEVIYNTVKYTAVKFADRNENTWTLLLSNEDASDDSRHEIDINGTSFSWEGAFKLIKY